MKKSVVVIITWLFIGGFSSSQVIKAQPEILPSIMVVPRVKKDQILQDVVDKLDEVRVGMVAVNNVFIDHDFDVKDFETVLNRIDKDKEVNSCNSCSVKELLFNSSSADLLVELDMVFVQDASGSKVRMPIEVNNQSSTKPWAVEILESNYFRTSDLGALVRAAINQKLCEDNNGDSISCMDKLIQEIKEYQIRICEVGNSAVLHFVIHEDSEITMDTKLPQADNTRLSFVIDDWLLDTSFNGYYKVDNSTQYQVIVEDYRFDCKSNIRKVQRKLSQFFDGLELNVQISQDQSILYVSIL